MPTRRGQLRKERQHVATLQLPADDHSAIGVNAVDLEHRLGNIQTDCRDILHRELLRIVGSLIGLLFFGTLVPVEEPSAAKADDIRGVSRVDLLPSGPRV